jgi:hypothetical protein
MMPQSLVHCVPTTVKSVCNISCVDLLRFLFDIFWGLCGENSCNVFLIFSMVLWVPIFATLCMRAMLMLWHTFMFLGLRNVGGFPLCSFLLGGFHYLSCTLFHNLRYHYGSDGGGCVNQCGLITSIYLPMNLTIVIVSSSVPCLRVPD